MNRFMTLAANGFVAAVAITGCGAGQQSQMTTQEPAINGSAATKGNIALRDVTLRAVQLGAEIAPGTPVDLTFVAVNTSPDDPDRLIRVTTDVGQVALTGKTDIAPAKTLLVGTQPAGETMSVGNTAKAVLTPSEPIQNGLNYTFDFEFANAGKISAIVPISAGEAPRQGRPSQPTEQPAGHH